MKSILSHFKQRIDLIFFLVSGWFFPKKGGGEVRTLLLIRTDGIGDAIFFSRYLVTLRNVFPDARVMFVCRPEAAEIAQLLGFNAVISYGFLAYRWNYLYRLFILRKIRSLRPSISIYLSYHRQHIGDEMTLLSGAPQTVAFDGNDEIISNRNRVRNNRYYSTIVSTDDHIPERLKYAQMLQMLTPGMKIESETPVFIKSNPPLNEKELPDRSFIVVSPGGSSSIRRWPAGNYVKLMDRLIGSNIEEIILCGSVAERSLLKKIASKSSRKPILMIGRPLSEVAAAIQSASVFVGNESGLLHLAASLGTPAVGILGGGHFSRYFPYGSARIVSHHLPCYECNWRCSFPEPYCLTWITVDDVMKEVEKVLEEKQL